MSDSLQLPIVFQNCDAIESSHRSRRCSRRSATDVRVEDARETVVDALQPEIGVVDGVPAPVAVHTMKARDKFLT